MGVRNSLAGPFYGALPKSGIAQYVLDNTQPGDSILVWGNNIGLYLETGRRNPSRYLYPQPLFLPNSGPESRFDQFLGDLQRDPPALIFGLDSSASGLPTINAPDDDLCPACIPAAVQGMKKLKDYVNENYVLIPLDGTANAYKRKY